MLGLKLWLCGTWFGTGLTGLESFLLLPELCKAQWKLGMAETRELELEFVLPDPCKAQWKLGLAGTRELELGKLTGYYTGLG